jgi:hypothetical protein
LSGLAELPGSISLFRPKPNGMTGIQEGEEQGIANLF